MLSLSRLGEKGLIRRIARRVRVDSAVIRGIGDDCAVLKPPLGKYLLFASDMLVEGVHFRRTADPAAIGWKALAVNVSDIAAMGGVPLHAVISLGLPNGTPVRFVDRIYKGLTRCAARFGLNLVGGDTDRSARIVIDVAILGEVERNRVVCRSGARAGDHLLVTGRLGGSLKSGRHLEFTPRLREARAIGAKAPIHAMIDLSDGLGPDLVRLCEASGVGAVIEAERVPRRPGCSLGQALTDGEDFELLMAVAPPAADHLLAWARRRRNLPCGLTAIGRIVRRPKGTPVKVVDSSGGRLPVSLAGFQHF
ncbi:MAG: thiamine-phosphate kinase [Candidatus Omnitrophica bacterium]|nr:thiamine-phosphate kinase [Candidatus Omnitrophota bacterium]